MMGVSLTERPEIVSADILSKVYYCLGLFVMGGMDLGTPVGGPLIGRLLLWLSYFGSPILAASTVIEALIKTLSPHKWRLHRIHNHIVIFGSGELTITYLKELRKTSPKVAVIVIDAHIDSLRADELKHRYAVKVIVGDLSNSYFLQKLRFDKAKKVLLLGQDNFQSYEAAIKILKLAPKLEQKIIVHCNSIRFMRAMAQSHVALKCINFNSYQLAAAALVQQHLICHFLKTKPKDVVVIAGFGLFGQTILEELQKHATKEIDTIAIIGIDAKRRIQVVDEQLKLVNFCRREMFEGNISHPQVWQNLRDKVDLNNSEPVIILCTDSAEDNLRTSLWLKGKHPNATIFARSHLPSKFAEEVGQQYDILNVSINQLVKENFPQDWLTI
jgi:hypothetical protein